MSPFNKSLLLRCLLWAQVREFDAEFVMAEGGVVAAWSELIMQRWEGSFVVLTLTAQLQHQDPLPRPRLPAGHLLHQFRHPGVGGSSGEIW